MCIKVLIGGLGSSYMWYSCFKLLMCELDDSADVNAAPVCKSMIVKKQVQKQMHILHTKQLLPQREKAF